MYLPPPHSLTNGDHKGDAPLLKSANTVLAATNVPPGWENLKPRERLALRLIAEGLTTQELADRFCLSKWAVTDIRRQLSAKLKLRGCNNLLKFVLHHRTFLCSD